MFFSMILINNLDSLLDFLDYFLVPLLICFSQRKKKSRMSFFCYKQSFFRTTCLIEAATLFRLLKFYVLDDSLRDA